MRPKEGQQLQMATPTAGEEPIIEPSKVSLKQPKEGGWLLTAMEVGNLQVQQGSEDIVKEKSTIVRVVHS